jgi:filamentous hemagglutinin
LQASLMDGLTGAGASDTTAKLVSKLIMDGVATGIGATTGGTAGAITALNEDANNRQLHYKERDLISRLAADKAQQACHSGDTQCVKSQTIFWTDTLERVARGDVDDAANQANLAYLNQLIAASQAPNSEGGMGMLNAYVQSLQEAQQILARSGGKPITVAGRPVLGGDSSVQIYFSATPAQRADDWTNRFFGQVPDRIMWGADMRDQDRADLMHVTNGSALPDTTIEQMLIGGKLQSTLGRTLGDAIARAPISAAGDVAASSSGNIAASKISTQASQAAFSAAEQALMAQIDQLPNTTLQGNLREYLVDNFFTRNGFTSLEGKCGPNCFDHIFTDGKQVYIVETKPLAGNGSIKLSPQNPATNLPAQMSDSWIDAALSRLRESGDPTAAASANTVAAARASGNLTKLVIGVDANGLTIVRLPTKP